MGSRRVQVVVLCEGEKDYRFAYRCLVDCGWRPDQISQKISPPGKGSAYDYVLASYPAEVRANRKGKGQRDLLVLVDADKKKEKGRRQQLDQRLQKAREPARAESDRIAVWVPTRQLEAWIYFLMHGSADETTDYKREHEVKDEERPPAARKFARILAKNQTLPTNAVPSMKSAVGEFKRIEARAVPVGSRSARRVGKRR